MAQVWLLPVLVFVATFALAVPIGLYMAGIFDGRLRAPRWLRWIEARLDTGPQNWKQYAFSFMAFNVVTFSAVWEFHHLCSRAESRRILGCTRMINSTSERSRTHAANHATARCWEANSG